MEERNQPPFPAAADHHHRHQSLTEITPNNSDYLHPQQQFHHLQLQINPSSSDQDRSGFAAGTYVVQVPKDQIYRVPPPENALVVERHRNLRQNKGSSPHSRRLWVFSLVILAGIVIGAVGGVASYLLRHEDPKFHVEKIALRPKQQHTGDPRNYQKNVEYEFDLSVSAENPNGHTTICYEEGDASLSFKEKVIGAGKFPKFDQGAKKSDDLKIVLDASKVGLPKEIETSMNSTSSKPHIAISLSMNIPVKFEAAGMKVAGGKIEVSCNFMVDNLGKNAHVSNRNCQNMSG